MLLLLLPGIPHGSGGTNGHVAPTATGPANIMISIGSMTQSATSRIVQF